MNKISFIIITAIVFTVSAQSAHAERNHGIARFLSAIAQAAEQGRQAHQQGYQEVDYHYANDSQGYANQGYYEQGPIIFDIRGDWVRGDGKVNRFQKTHQGYYVSPVGRGRGVHYVEIGENLYQDANSSGTYEVIDDYYMVWTSNDRRNVTIELFRR